MMPLPSELSSTGIVSELQHVEFQKIAKFIISRQLRTGDYGIIEKVAAKIPREPQFRLKEAMFYLEYADWNLHDALMHIELDNDDRNGSWLPVDLEENGNNATSSNSTGRKRKREEGKSTDQTDTSTKSNVHHSVREYAKPGKDFDEALFTLSISSPQARAPNTYRFPEKYKRNFDKKSQDDIDDLNRWRRAIIWSKLGADNSTTIRGAGERWHPLQETFVRNRFAFVTINNTESQGNSTDTRPDFNGIFDLYKEIFEGVLLPGRSNACKARTYTAITSFLHRDCIDRPLRLGGMNVTTVKSLPTNVKHEMARDLVVKEWEQRVSRMNMDKSKDIKAAIGVISLDPGFWARINTLGSEFELRTSHQRFSFEAKKKLSAALGDYRVSKIVVAKVRSTHC